MKEGGKLQVERASGYKSIENEKSKPRNPRVECMDIEDKEKNLEVSKEQTYSPTKCNNSCWHQTSKKAYLSVEWDGITFSKGLRE